MQLGLDISTTTVGYAVTSDTDIIDMGFVDLKKISIRQLITLLF